MGRQPKADAALVAVRAAEPPLSGAGALCVEAWQTLATTRPMTGLSLGLAGSMMLMGAIPWPAIRDWCAWKRLGRAETEIVVSVLSRLDGDRSKREAEKAREAARTAGQK